MTMNLHEQTRFNADMRKLVAHRCDVYGDDDVRNKRIVVLQGSLAILVYLDREATHTVLATRRSSDRAELQVWSERWLSNMPALRP